MARDPEEVVVYLDSVMQEYVEHVFYASYFSLAFLDCVNPGFEVFRGALERDDVVVVDNGFARQQ